MKKIGIILILFGLLTLSLSSCKKEESTVTGTLTYIGAISGIEYYASNATVYLYYGSVELDDTPLQVTADENGVYSFTFLQDGNWQVVATTEVNGFTYTATSNVFWTTGEDTQTINLVLYN